MKVKFKKNRQNTMVFLIFDNFNFAKKCEKMRKLFLFSVILLLSIDNFDFPKK